MSVILPGEQFPAEHVNLKLGPGLLQVANNDVEKTQSSIIATRAGMLNHSANGSKWWVESNSRRYVPAAQESVIGVITQRVGDGYRVDIGSAHPASLDGLGFEGATKRNKPNLKIGYLVYARVSLAHKDMDPELECFDAQTRKAEGFGELKGGFMPTLSPITTPRNTETQSHSLLDPNHFLLPLLGGKFPLEAAIGVNGRVWINAKEVKQIIAISRCIEAVDPDGSGLDAERIKNLLDTFDV